HTMAPHDRTVMHTTDNDGVRSTVDDLLHRPCGHYLGNPATDLAKEGRRVVTSVDDEFSFATSDDPHRDGNDGEVDAIHQVWIERQRRAGQLPYRSESPSVPHKHASPTVCCRGESPCPL